MPKYLVTAIKSIVCQFEVESDSPENAYKSLDDWVSDDFEQHEVKRRWDIDVEETE